MGSYHVAVNRRHNQRINLFMTSVSHGKYRAIISLSRAMFELVAGTFYSKLGWLIFVEIDV